MLLIRVSVLGAACVISALFRSSRLKEGVEQTDVIIRHIALTIAKAGEASES